MASQLQAREYLLLGDSNVSRFYTKIGLSQANNIDFVKSRNVEEVSAALASIKRSYKFVVMAFWSNLIIDAGDTGNNDVDRMSAIDGMFNDIVPLIRDAISSNRGPSFFLAPPTIRTRPSWYLPLLPNVMRSLVCTLRVHNPALSTLKSFMSTPKDLDSDGSHFNALSGRDYVLYLLDQSRLTALAQVSKNPTDRFSFLMEEVNTLSTVVAGQGAQMAILNDQVMLTRCQMFEELAGRINSDNLSHFMVMGAPYLPLSEGLQERLRNQVISYIRALGANLPTNILHVRQFKNRKSAASAPTANYDVEMDSVESSERIRSAYGSFWKKPKPGTVKVPIPAILSNVSIGISHTFCTRIRVRLMKQMAKRHQEANPDLNIFVTNFLPRPNLKVRQQGGRVSTYQYVEAVRRFSHHLTPEFLQSEADYARSNVTPENLASYFLVLSSDLTQSPLPPTPQSQGGPSRPKPVKRGSDGTIPTTSKKARGKGGKGGKAKGKKDPTEAPPPATSNPFDALASPEVQSDQSLTERSFVGDQISQKSMETSE